MTTTTTARPAPARLAWAPLDLDRDLTPCAPPRVCAGLFFVVGAGGLHPLALADRWDRDLPDVSSPADSPQFCDATAVAGVRVDDHRYCASEGGAIGWVADHRKHHAHSDDEDDTHTPLRGFCWAHMFWWMKVDEDFGAHARVLSRSGAPTSARDPVHVWLEQVPLHLPDHAVREPLYLIGGMPWLVWGGFVRSVFVLHSTWLVNSATHVWGYRSHETRDKSTNLWWVAMLTYGEGWHNNHHAYQTSARHGLRWWEVDMTYLAIRHEAVPDRL